MRSDPDAEPDNNHTEYEFRLTKMNAFNGNSVAAVMVRAIPTSTEYGRRGSGSKQREHLSA